ncbi:hypothetical protein ElyMa_007071500 [Elysia marginata]|uniref:Uncharacterized protein n=1 Tax=Elysia marginata TaxID=1093978 RepID=A0AAV4JX17_9GAST|nr:hypothetical protein ElyMa_007071500 [Elysia marginata]
MNKSSLSGHSLISSSKNEGKKRYILHNQSTFNKQLVPVMRHPLTVMRAVVVVAGERAVAAYKACCCCHGQARPLPGRTTSTASVAGRHPLTGGLLALLC